MLCPSRDGRAARPGLDMPSRTVCFVRLQVIGNKVLRAEIAQELKIVIFGTTTADAAWQSRFSASWQPSDTFGESKENLVPFYIFTCPEGCCLSSTTIWRNQSAAGVKIRLATKASGEPPTCLKVIVDRREGLKASTMADNGSLRCHQKDLAEKKGD